MHSAVAGILFALLKLQHHWMLNRECDLKQSCFCSLVSCSDCVSKAGKGEGAYLRYLGVLREVKAQCCPSLFLPLICCFGCNGLVLS